MTTSTLGGKERAWLCEEVVAGLMRASDCVVIAATGGLAYANLPDPADGPGIPLLLVIIAVLLMSQAAPLFGAHVTWHAGRPASPLRILCAWTVVVGALAAAQPLYPVTEGGMTAWFTSWFLYGAGGLLVTHTLCNRWIRQWYRRGTFARRVVIAGTADYALPLASHIARTRDESVQVLGLFCNGDDGPPSHTPAPFPMLGDWEDLESFVRERTVDAVVLAIPWHAERYLAMWMARLRNLPVDVFLCPPVTSTTQSVWCVSSMAGHRFLKVSERPLGGWRYIAKAMEDRVLALALLVLFAPLMLLIAVAIRLDTPGPVLFRQKRHGFNNTIIEVLKFRTMAVEVCREDRLVQQVCRNDPRLTRTGYWLRRTSLDELPQLFNVLRGEMSLVGPRPHAVSHNEQYAAAIDAYVGRHRMKPGITGWAQVNGLRGETDTLEKMENRVKYDLYYIEHWSVLFDLYILARTLVVGFVHPNAY